MTVSIFDYIDYRDYLRDFWVAQKEGSPNLSLRGVALKLGVDCGNFLNALGGKRQLTPSILNKIKPTLHLNAKESKYFDTLVEFSRSRSSSKSRQLFRQLLEIKEVKQKELVALEYEYYRTWYHMAVFALLDCYDFRENYKELGSKLNPPISESEAKLSIETLEGLKLIEKNEKGIYQYTYQALTTGNVWKSSMIHHFQKEMIQLSERALREQPKKVRDISTLTFSFPKKSLEEVRQAIAQFRKTISKIVHEEEYSDSVYQLNVQFFPLTKLEER